MSNRLTGKRRQRAVERLIERDGTRCHYCDLILRQYSPEPGVVPPFDAMTIDHVIPLSAGGTNVLSNLVLSCEGCNQERGGIHGEGAYPHLVGKISATGKKSNPIDATEQSQDPS